MNIKTYITCISVLHKLCDDLNRFHENKIIKGNHKKTMYGYMKFKNKKHDEITIFYFKDQELVMSISQITFYLGNRFHIYKT
jgi:predicted ester cyclase